MALKIIIVLLSLLGVLGTLLPMVPGTPLILLATLIYAIITDFLIINWKFIIILILMSITAESLEYLASVLGAKYFGASKYGIIGAVAGGILGLIFLGPLGLVVGPLLSAVILEMILGKKFEEAIKVGLGTIVGNLGGSLVSFIISVIMTILLINRVF